MPPSWYERARNSFRLGAQSLDATPSYADRPYFVGARRRKRCSGAHGWPPPSWGGAGGPARSADRAPAQPDDLRGVAPRDEVRPGRYQLTLPRHEPVAGALRQHHDRPVALQIRLLVDGEGEPAPRRGRGHSPPPAAR